jgi:hypothetical protein
VYFISKEDDVADLDNPCESFVPRNAGEKADTAESIDRKRTVTFMFNLVDIAIARLVVIDR